MIAAFPEDAACHCTAHRQTDAMTDVSAFCLYWVSFAQPSGFYSTTPPWSNTE